jgi:hypothetical protein
MTTRRVAAVAGLTVCAVAGAFAAPAVGHLPHSFRGLDPPCSEGHLMLKKRYVGMAVAGLVIAVVVAPFALVAWSIVGVRSLFEPGETAGVR